MLPFDLGSLPRVTSSQAGATRAALRTCASLPDHWSVELPPLGSTVIWFVGIDPDGDGRDTGEAVELPVAFGAARGRLAIEAMFAARLVDTLLGGRGVFSAMRAIGPAEAGVLSGLLAPALDRIGGSIRIGPALARGARRKQAASIVLRVDTVVASGEMRLTVPVGGLPRRAEDIEAWRTRAGRLPVIGQLELAETGVSAAALVRLAAGDAVVFDGVPVAAFAPDTPWRCRLRVGAHAAKVTVGVDGTATFVGEFSPLISEERVMSTSGSNMDAVTVLSAASIEVVAELGRIMLRGDELLGLAPGAVLALGVGRGTISLRVGGEIWADGEIVDIDGELGVRVTRLERR